MGVAGWPPLKDKPETQPREKPELQSRRSRKEDGSPFLPSSPPPRCCPCHPGGRLASKEVD